MDEGESSWKERCDRYFTSLTDSDDKDRDQEKDEKLKRKDEMYWRSVADLPESREGSVTRYIRRVLSSLDIHGTRFAAKSPSVVELVLWIIIVVAASAGLAFVVYLQVTEYYKNNRYFGVQGPRTLTNPSDSLSLTVCNLNILRKSVLSGSRFANLASPNYSPTVVSNYRISSQTNAAGNILANSESIKSGLQTVAGDSFENLLKELNDDLSVKLLNSVSSASDWQMLYDAAIGGGRTDLLGTFLQLSRNDLTAYGYREDDMLVQCWLGNRRCRDGETRKVQDQSKGNCVTVTTHSPKEKVELLLNAQPDEYIDSITPSVGAAVFVHEKDTPFYVGTEFRLSPSQDLHLTVDKVSIAEHVKDCKDDISYNKVECLEACANSETEKICGCSVAQFAQNRCGVENKVQYVCALGIQKLQTMGKLDCSCTEKCRTKNFYLSSSCSSWPSDGHLVHTARILQNTGLNMSESEIRSSLMKLSVVMDTAFEETFQEIVHFSILDLFARIGGISALIAGISVVTLGEVLWMFVRLICDVITYLRRRSKGIQNSLRLTDSEITSITWAMHRERRKEEVKNQSNKYDRHDKIHQQGVTISGNVQSRIQHKRGSYLAPITEEGSSKNTKEIIRRESMKTLEDELYAHPWERTGHRRPYSHIVARTRGSGDFTLPNSMDNRGYVPSRSSTSDKNDSARYNDVLHLEGLARKQATNYPDTNRTVTPGDAVKFYGGSSAYFYSPNISNPMYL